MAGSYDHCVDKKTGHFCFDLIENMGDAHEACHEMAWIIRQSLSERKLKKALKRYHRRCRGEKEFEEGWGIESWNLP